MQYICIILTGMVIKLLNFNFILKLNHINVMKNYEKKLIIEYPDNNVIFYKKCVIYAILVAILSWKYVFCIIFELRKLMVTILLVSYSIFLFANFA